MVINWVFTSILDTEFYFRQLCAIYNYKVRIRVYFKNNN
jgi:hypothetical protein